MSRFRKLPVEIEAWQVMSREKAPGWLTWALCDGVARPDPHHADHILVGTLEGEMRAAPGDWTIRGVKGELYPCKPGIFAATYEPVA